MSPVSSDRQTRIFNVFWSFLAWLQRYIEVVREMSPDNGTDPARTVLISRLSEYLQPFLRADLSFIGHRDLEPEPADSICIVKDSLHIDQGAHRSSALLNQIVHLGWRFPAGDLAIIRSGKPVMLFDQGLQKLPKVLQGFVTALAAEVVTLSGREYYLFFCDVDSAEKGFPRYDGFDTAMLSVATGILEIGFQSGIRRGRSLEEEETRRFLGDLVHELKTPIQGILADASNLFAETPESMPELRQMASRNVSSAHHLSLLIDTILLTMDRLPPDTEQLLVLPLSSAIDEAIGMFVGEAQLMGIEIVGPTTVTGQPLPRLPMYFRELVIAFKNLLHNAMTYSLPQASGRYEPVRVVGYTAGEGYYAVDVVNYGIEITSEEIRQDRLFEHRYRGTQARELAVTGSGLGLASVRRTVKRHGGEIRIRSEWAAPGLYRNTFTIQLPLSVERGRHEPDTMG